MVFAMRIVSSPGERRFPVRRSALLLLPGLMFLLLTGSVTAQTVKLTPATLTFGNTLVGATSAAQKVTLANSGRVTLSISSIVAGADFSQTNTCGSSLRAGKTCTISVRFSPTTTGLASGVVTITDNAGNSRQTIGASGTGVAAVTLSPAAIAFASQTAGTTSNSMAVTVTNNLSTTLSITSVTVNGNFAETNTCGSSLAHGKQCIISVTFTPTVVGALAGTLTVTDSGNNSPQTANLSGTAAAAGQVAITTYHYDNYRTGWNANEPALIPATVGSSSFGLLHSVTLDDQVQAQPLVVPGVNITAGNFQGTHDVVYVVTENNTVYAIDAESGQILLNPNFGPPVDGPLGCNTGINVGINSTPVIDLGSNTIYVMVYTNDGPTYRLHALDLGSLSDQIAPVVVSASHTLTDGTTLQFNATYEQQRPALLLANGNVYAGFGSFCDFDGNLSRGWLLGWSAGSLTPLPANQLNDTQPSDTHNVFLSSIWMSGYGPAADDSGNVLFVTANSDRSGTAYNGVTNIAESAVKMAPDLSAVLSLFTPSDQPALDAGDVDFGSGGVMVLPDQPGSLPHLAVAAGKNGHMYFMNEDSLGGFSTAGNNVLGDYTIGGCWCGPSYFIDPTDQTARVVSSGGTTATVWKLRTSPSYTLSSVTGASVGTSVQYGGFFTSISSSGNANPIIWAVARPVSYANYTVSLFAFNPDAGGKSMQLLFRGVAGAWANVRVTANLVPVVANGEVFVASYRQLQIFGLLSPKNKAAKKK